MKRKILLINFKRIGDIISSLSAIKMDDEIEYHMLCYKEFSKVPKSINESIKFHFVDRKKIEFLLKSPLINDSFAIKELNNSIKDIQNDDWSEIVNFSNDKLGGRLVSLFKNSRSKIRGIYFDNNKVQHPGSWEIYYNNVVPQSKIHPVNLKDIFGYMTGNPNTADSNILRIGKKHDGLVQANYNTIREKYSNYGKQAKLIGLAPFASTDTKSLSIDETVNLINLMKQSDRAQVPILIHAPIASEQEKVSEIANFFDGNLITIEADLLALNSVLHHLDTLISVDSATIHYANALGLNSLMVAKGEAPLFLQGTSEPGDLILTNIQPGKIIEEDNIDPEEIFTALQLIVAPNKVSDLTGLNSRLYLVNSDAFGTYYMQITPHEDFTLNEIKRDLLRNFVMKSLVGYKTKFHVPKRILSIEASRAFFEAEKLKVFSITKSVLTCLRLVKATSYDGQNQFVKTLQEVITNMEDTTSTTAMPVNLFFQEINQVDHQDPEENKKFFEKKLFELKNNLQVLFGLYKEYETILIAQKAEKSQKSIRNTEVHS